MGVLAGRGLARGCLYAGSLTVHCSGLGGGLLSPDHDYDIFFQNHAQMKVYGPSLAMTDDWEQRVTQLGLTKTIHEYAVYQLLSTALGWRVWKAFLPERFADHRLLLTRAIRLLTAATIRPAHARPPHPTWMTATRQILRWVGGWGPQYHVVNRGRWTREGPGGR